LKQVIAKAGDVMVVEVPAPTCRENEILIRTAFSVISTGTETWTIDATEPISANQLMRDSSRIRKAIHLVNQVWKGEGAIGLVDYVKSVRNPQVPLGYSSAGVVMALGKQVTDFTIGDRVACAGEGKATHAEFVAVPRNLVTKVPDGVEFQDAAFATIGAIALQGFRRSGAQIGESVVVIGAGLVGNIVAQICKSSGCNVVVLDLKQERLELAKEVGADLALSTKDDKLDEHVRHFTNGRGADAVIVCAATSGSEPINLASRLARDRARITIVGRVGMEIERKDYYQKELDLSMSRSLGPGRYDPVYEEDGVDYPVGYVRWTLNRNMEGFLGLVKNKRVRLRELIGGVYQIERATEAYEALKVQSSKAAVLLDYHLLETKHLAVSSNSVTLTERGAKGRTGVALIGPGNFAKETMIPILRRTSTVNLRWVIASNPLHSRQVAERYRFQRCGTNFGEVLSDAETRAVFITAPNNLHYPMVLDAARAGKAVFVEKPLCLNRDELEDIAKAQAQTGARIVVGFNRRYSPFILKAKEILDRLDGPFLLNYRVNADYIPLARWVQDPEIGGGRIIAEGCHFFDLFNFLLKSSHPEVTVACAGVNDSSTVTRDNYQATLKYGDGSVASLTYSALGNRSMERERLEIFGQGVAMAMEDFSRLTVYNREGKMQFSFDGQDKGHRKELDEFLKSVQGEPSSIISFKEAVEAMEVTFKVEELARAQNSKRHGDASSGV
jgi:predicted dehydrogenase/threonine dehydrogenase-like Zn-dependent dehydrogenase